MIGDSSLERAHGDRERRRCIHQREQRSFRAGYVNDDADGMFRHMGTEDHAVSRTIKHHG
jgi:hypothetical protein